MTESSRKRFNDFLGPFKEGKSDRDAEPGLPAPKTGATSRWPYLRFYFQWLGPYRGQILLVLGLALVSTTLGLVPPYATKLIVDEILETSASDASIAERLSTLHLVGAAILLLLLVQQGFEALRNYRMSLLNFRVVRRLQQTLYEHLLKLPIHELQQMKTGGISTRVSSDVDDVSGLLQMGLITPTVATVRVVCTMGILIWIQWRMAVLATVILVAIVLINMLWIRKLKPLHRSIRRDRGEVNARVVETFGGLPVVRAFRRERTEARDFAVGQNTVIRKRMLSRLYHLRVSTAWGLLIPVSSLLIIWYGGTQYLVQQLTIGEIIAFQMYVFMLMMPISQIVQSWSDTQHSLAALERTFDVMNRSVDMPDRPHAIAAPRNIEELVFENVTFGYLPNRPVLFDFSVRVRGGQTVALVGPSGAGKTTVTNLVARFYAPNKGRILLNGTDLADVKLASYRSLLGMVQQDVFLFDGTISDNIAYGRRGASSAEIADAARRANAHEFITQFPEGFDTLIGERGIKLSGGQKQRVSIARAILADPRILILDEATSSLDSESEQLIQASLVDLLANRTTFVIAHRLSTVTRAHLILVLDEGRIVQQGTHESLLASGGLYADMVARQLQHQWMDAADQGLDWS